MVNGGAESPLVGGELPGWTELLGATWTRSPSGGWVPPPEGNYHFFAGAPTGGAGCSSVGSNQFTSILSQTIDLSGYSTEIDAGIQAFYFSGYVRTWADAAYDESRIVVVYEDATSTPVDTFDTGPTASTCCGNSGVAAGWLQLTDTRFPPVGTRSVTIYLAATRMHGCDNDGYFDDIIFQPTCVTGTTAIDVPSICEGGDATLSVTGQSGTIVWEYSYNSGGSWNSFGSNGTSQSVNPILNPTVANSPVLFRPVLTEATCTNSSSNQVSLTINPPAVGGTVSAASTTLCEGDAINLTLAGETGIIQWQQSDNGGPFINVGTGTNTFSTTPTIGQSPLVFRNISTLGSCTDTSNTETITIIPNALGGTTSLSSSSICDGESSDVSLSGESGTIQWQQSINGGAFTNFGTGTNSETVSPTFAQTPMTYRAIVTSGICSDTSTTSTLTINQAAVGGTVSAAMTTLCEGDNADLTLAGETGTIQWQQSDNGGAFTNVGTGTNMFNTTPTIGQSPLVFRNIATLGTCTDTSNTETITILPDAVGGTTSLSNANICEGESSDVTLSGELGTIQWQQSINGAAFTNFGAGTNSETVSPTFAQTPMTYRAILTSGSCSDTSTTSTLTINESALGGTLVVGSNNICHSASTSLTLTGERGVIQWQRSLAGGAWSNFSTTPPSITVSPTGSDSPAQYRAVLTHNGTCMDTSNTVTITIDQPIGGTTSLSSNPICDGSSSIVSLSGETGTIQWQQSFNGGVYANFGSGTNSETVSPNVSQSIAAYRTIVTIGSCTDTSNVVSLTVDTAANPGTTSILPDTLCEGSSTSLTNTGNNGVIQWQRSYNGGSWNNFGTGLISETINPVSSNSVAHYRAIITKGLCSDTSNLDSIIIINTDGGITSINAPAICEGSSALVSLSGEIGNIQWQRSLAGGAYNNFGSNGSSELVSPTISESLALYRVVTSIGSCSDTSNVTQLFVDSAANTGITDIIPDTLCEGSSTVVTNTGANGSLQWQQSFSGGAWVNFGSGLTNENINPTSANSIAQYRAIITRGLCTDTSNLDSIIIVNPIGGTTSLNSTAICDGESTQVSITGETGTIQWEESLAGGPFTTFGTAGSTETITPTNANSPAQYRVNVSIGTCSVTSTISTLTINPAAVGGTASIVTDSMCNGTSENLTLSGHSGNIQWQESLAGGVWNNFGSGLNPEPISPTTLDNTPSYRAITTLGTCVDTSSIDSVFVIDVNAGTVTIGSPTICEGSSTTLNVTGQIGTIQWQQSLAGGGFTNFGSGGTSEIVNPTGTDNPVIYRLVVNTSSCTATSSNVNLTVQTTPGIPSPISGTTNSCSGDTESYSVATQSDATSYNWTTTTGTITSGAGTNSIDALLLSPSTTIEVFPVNSCGQGATSTTLNVTVDDYPVPTINQSDTAICSGDMFSMTASETSGIPTGQLTYLWMLNGSNTLGTSSSQTINTGGAYTIDITNNGVCTSSSSTVTVSEVFVDVDAGPTQYINPGDFATLGATSNGAYSYLWTPSTDLSDPNVLTPTANPNITTQYFLTATSTEGCTDTSSTVVSVLQFITPTNAFTPNDDGLNDLWELPGLQAYPEHTVEIFNRWGTRVYFSNNFVGWDGTYNGKKLPLATYYYIITLDEIEAPLTGSVSIIY